MSNTGILADTVVTECAGGCGGILVVPARIAADARCYSCLEAQTEHDARAQAEKVRRGADKTNNNRRGK